MKEYTKNLGKVVMTPKGAWSIEKEYEILDIVHDSVTDHAYISKQEVPSGVDLSDSRYWMPLNVSGYSDSNVITLNSFNENGEIQSYTLEEAIKTIKDVGRKSGTILIFYNDNTNRLDITIGCWEIWQFNSINVYDWENLDAWINIYYNYNKFVGWYAADNILNKEIPNPDVGCYAFVGNIYNEAFVYRCDVKNRWTKTNQKAQHYIKVVFGDNVIIGENGNWWQDGIDTNIPVSVKGDNGLTPYLRWSKNNQIEYSYDNINWHILSDEFNTNIKIKAYVGSVNELPNNVELGVIYGVGPVYAEDDVEQKNPIYNIYVYTSNGWVNNGGFNSISVGVVQEKGNSITEVMSQDAVTKEFIELQLKDSMNLSALGVRVYYQQNYGLLPSSTTEVYHADGTMGTYDLWAKTEPIGFDKEYPLIGFISSYNVNDIKIPGLVWVDSNNNFVGCIDPPKGENLIRFFNSEEITIPDNAVAFVLQTLTKTINDHYYKNSLFDRIGIVSLTNKGIISSKLLKDAVITEDPAYQSLITKEIIYEYSGSTFNRPFSSPINIKKGKKYIAEVVFDGVSDTFQMGSLLNSDIYIDTTPILYKIDKYIFEFEATEDSSMFIVYSSNILNMEFKLTEQSMSIIELKSEIKYLENRLTNIVSNRSTNTVVVASFDGQENDAMIFEGWAKGIGLNNREYYGCSASETPFASAAKINKYVTASNRKIIWDIDVNFDTKVCAFTQGIGLENLYAQGYCVVADFSANTFAIHKNYGSSGKDVSETLPSVLKSTTFDADIDNKSLFRIIMERVERTLKATLVYLKTNTILAELKTTFEREIVPSSGLGYDIPAITPLSGLMAIYSAKLLIPNAKPCFLYIVGDSITEGVPCQQKDGWAYKIADVVPNTIVSGRGGGTIDGVLRKIQDEASVLKPTYVMVTIGTNGGNTPEKLSQMVDAIKTIGATPIINTVYCSSTSVQASINDDILALKERCVRMDVATAINNNLLDGADASLFISDGIHLNEQGNEKCYQQVLIDMPELYM